MPILPISKWNAPDEALAIDHRDVANALMDTEARLASEMSARTSAPTTVSAKLLLDSSMMGAWQPSSILVPPYLAALTMERR